PRAPPLSTLFPYTTLFRSTNAWEIVFWRSLFMALFVAGVLVALHGRRMPRAVLAVGRPGLLSGFFLAGTFFFFIGSLTRTTVAKDRKSTRLNSSHVSISYA